MRQGAPPVTSDLEPIFQAVRAACSSRSWSQGIELARSDAVDGVSDDGEQVSLRVKSPGRTVAPVVVLYPEDDEWVCACDSSADACEHVAAAIIALRRVRKEGQALPVSGKAGGTVGYRLSVDPSDGTRVVVDRVVVGVDGKEQPLTASVAGVLSGREAGPEVEPTAVDLSIDQLLSMRRLRALPADSFASVVPLLAQVTDVRLGDEPVSVSADPLELAMVVEDDGHGFALTVEVAGEAVEMVTGSLALRRDETGAAILGAVGDLLIASTPITRLPAKVQLGRDRAAELVAEILPSLRDRGEVEIRTKKLPARMRHLEPEVLIEVSQRGAALSVLPVLVYGDPPCARVDGSELVHLGGPLPKREPRAEARALEALHAELDLTTGRRVDRVGEAAVELAAKLRGFRGKVSGDVHRTLYPDDALRVDVAVDGSRLGVRFVGGQPGEELGAAPHEVLRAWADGASVVPLLGGGWARLPSDWLARHGARLASLLAAKDAAGQIAPHAQPELLRLCDELEQPRPLELGRLAPLVDGFTSIPRAELPADLRAELRDYQRQGVDWLCFLRDAGLGAMLADDMGLGKTLQVLCALKGRVLVVCPRSVVHNWVDEIERFRPDLRHAVYHGPGRALDAEADVTLTTYALLRGDIELLAAERWDAVVLDESQAIKNPDSQVAQAAHSLPADFRVTLSGTPVENRLEELWSQMHFANRGLLAGREAFHRDVEQPIERGEPGAAARLRERIKPFLLRRLKREVLKELPPRTEMLLHCELDEDEREIYQAIEAATRADVVARLEAGGSALEALEALLRLRQAACDAALVPGQAHMANAAGRPRASSKVQRLLDALDQAAADGHKALVFSQWTSLLDRVEPQLQAAGLRYVRLDGSTRDRAAVVATFQDPDGPPVMLISLKAGGTGLNLTAADHVFLLDPWWNPAVEDQAADRAHRIGQERPVMIYRLVADDTVEERILALQDHKRALGEAALGEADQAARLSRDDLLQLLGG